MMLGIVPLFLVLALPHFTDAKCRNGIKGHGVSNEEREAYIRKHNQLRDLISQGKVPGQPRGLNLKKMVHSQELEDKAQVIADSCEFEHQVVSATKWKHVGQNLYVSSSTSQEPGADWDRAIQAWFDEYKLYNFGTKQISGTGHYTQVVWANTDHVGCAYTFYKDSKTGWYNKLYVCHYGPAGNYVGQAPYKTA